MGLSVNGHVAQCLCYLKNGHVAQCLCFFFLNDVDDYVTSIFILGLYVSL